MYTIYCFQMSTGDVTRKLDEIRLGDQSAWPGLIQLVYADLRRVAATCLRKEYSGCTLQPTALVHEAYIRLRRHQPEWQDRRHFLAVASQLMRLILVDHARRRRRLKRNPAGVAGLTISPPDSPELVDVLAIHEGLNELARLSSRQTEVVELRFFGGLTFEETAEVTGIPLRTVKRDWSIARAWLHAYLEGNPIG
jgi:RNA polymerase sigma-70 factor, ECF subfamily